MNLLKLLGFGVNEPGGESEDRSAAGVSQAETEAVRKIAGQLRELDPARARYTAAFAYILSRVANADSNISERETREMEKIVREIGGLNEGQAALVVEMAKTHSMLFAGTDDFLSTAAALPARRVCSSKCRQSNRGAIAILPLRSTNPARRRS